MHGFQGFQPTKSRANVHANAVRHALRDGQTRVLHGFLTRCHEQSGRSDPCGAGRVCRYSAQE